MREGGMMILEAVNPAYKYWRKEFSREFAKFLGKFYLGRLQTRYNGEKCLLCGSQITRQLPAQVIETIRGKIRHLEGNI